MDDVAGYRGVSAETLVDARFEDVLGYVYGHCAFALGAGAAAERAARRAALTTLWQAGEIEDDRELLVTALAAAREATLAQPEPEPGPGRVRLGGGLAEEVAPEIAASLPALVRVLERQPAASRSVLDIALRHGLDDAEMAAALNLEQGNALIVTGRLLPLVKDAMQAALDAGTLGVCEGRDAILGRAGDRTFDLERALIDHALGCVGCSREHDSRPSPLQVVTALSAPPPPARLAAEVRTALAQQRLPEPREAEEVAEQAEEPKGQWRRLGLMAGVMGGFVAVVALVLFAPFSPLAVVDSVGQAMGGGDDAEGTPSATATQRPAVAAATAARPGATGTALVAVPGTATASATGTAGGSPTATGTATETPAAVTPTPGGGACVPKLVAEPRSISLRPGEQAEVTIRNSAQCGEVTFGVVGGTVSWLEVPTRSGTISGTQSARVLVKLVAGYLPGTGEGTFSDSFTISSEGAGSATVLVSAQQIGAAPVVSSVEAVCSGETLTVRTVISDDYGVTGVVAGPSAQGTVSMTLVAGGRTGGTWEATFRAASASGKVAVNARDGAGNPGVGTADFACGP